MTERLAGWFCIGCGRIEVPRACVGICEDRPTELVTADDHDAAMAQAELVRRERDAVTALLRRLAAVTPRDGEWERSYRALQREARSVLQAVGRDGESADGDAVG
jgi:hypothetical protein